jgi:hypothetical protein
MISKGGAVRGAGACVPSPTALQAVRERGRVPGSVSLLGPAFVAAVAYVDPLIQSLSGNVGLATGRNLPELCREHFRGRSPVACGSRPSWSRWPPTWPRWSVARSRCTCCSACRCSPGAS